MTIVQKESDPNGASSGSIDDSRQSPQPKWQRYLDADLGFSNHWHPVMFSHELDEGAFIAQKVMGEEILLTRVNGEVRAVEDRCAHRGVRLSRDPLCFKKGTVSCWYHGWTYNLDDGQLSEVLTSPGSPVIGQVGISVIPIQEAQGLIFVFIGDEEPHDLAEDVPPGFLDPDTHCLGIRRTVQSNWRLGVENGFDTTHILVHRNSPLIEANNLAVPFGFVPAGRDAILIQDKEWPRGVIDNQGTNYIPVFDVKLDGETVLHKEWTEDLTIVADQLSVWLPGVNKVDPFPDPSMIQYEFYVAIDENQHEYFQVLQRKVQSEADVAAFTDEFENKWRDLALHGFNDDDVWAREELQHSYNNKNGWHEEHLFPPDMCIVHWRQLASARARGVKQSEGNK